MTKQLDAHIESKYIKSMVTANRIVQLVWNVEEDQDNCLQYKVSEARFLVPSSYTAKVVEKAVLFTHFFQQPANNCCSVYSLFNL